MPFFNFNADEIQYIQNLKAGREKNQYYLERIELKDEDSVRKFILSCKAKLNELNSAKIERIREELKSLIRTLLNLTHTDPFKRFKTEDVDFIINEKLKGIINNYEG